MIIVGTERLHQQTVPRILRWNLLGSREAKGDDLTTRRLVALDETDSGSTCVEVESGCWNAWMTLHLGRGTRESTTVPVAMQGTYGGNHRTWSRQPGAEENFAADWKAVEDPLMPCG